MRWSRITDPALPPLAISLGDPAGVGPELICESWARREAEGLPPFFVCGGKDVLSAAARARGLAIDFAEIFDPCEAGSAGREALPVLGDGDASYTPGNPSSLGARLAFNSLQAGTGFAVSGAASGIVTGPIAKAALAEVGFDFPGQTEFVADACGVPAEDAVMLLAGPSLRTVPLTVHCALADVPGLLTQGLIVRRCRVVAEAMRTDYGIAQPRIAIAGLNPHAGEAGRMGREEIEIIAPAIAQLRADGIDATGPHPADTLFAPRARATYDVAIAMYHDQALVPLKALDFDQGVNVTLGLPIVRTSPDHGTAFDIAGKGLADPGAMIAAIRMAGEIAARRTIAQ
ncbi:4-hydroxythreonine-4-phosphate dehydrogenase PdxA [Croceibacterium aestuarii]|uniref:4-hydroxythreonine-4-phosphate dehydrogenase PdxA n=1 Tax=Croceibacterium aestuarii TaxID=3064139 RepID=UPI00272E0FE4|nr:4-hydroxythreonine-4-phosphate dehydrogenase PdxA [Croceibacterium sp. D39]